MIICNYKLTLYIYIYLRIYKFFKKIKFCDLGVSNDILPFFQKKKNLFFKKKFRMRVLIYRRLSFALRKRRRQYKFRIKQKSNKGKFFFKKFFYKTLLKSRKYLRSFFFFNKKVRQHKITKNILKNQTRQLNNMAYEYTILNVLLRSQFCIFLNDAKSLIKSGFIYINGLVLTDWSFILQEGDCLQLRISKSIYRYFFKSKKFLKKKIALFRYNV